MIFSLTEPGADEGTCAQSQFGFASRRAPFPSCDHNLTSVVVLVDKNSKESFIKKIHLCSKIYDYKDETKDVKGKVSPLPH